MKWGNVNESKPIKIVVLIEKEKSTFWKLTIRINPIVKKVIKAIMFTSLLKYVLDFVNVV